MFEILWLVDTRGKDRVHFVCNWVGGEWSEVFFTIGTGIKNGYIRRTVTGYPLDPNDWIVITDAGKEVLGNG